MRADREGSFLGRKWAAASAVDVEPEGAGKKAEGGRGGAEAAAGGLSALSLLLLLPLAAAALTPPPSTLPEGNAPRESRPTEPGAKLDCERWTGTEEEPVAAAKAAAAAGEAEKGAVSAASKSGEPTAAAAFEVGEIKEEGIAVGALGATGCWGSAWLPWCITQEGRIESLSPAAATGSATSVTLTALVAGGGG